MTEQFKISLQHRICITHSKLGISQSILAPLFGLPIVWHLDDHQCGSGCLRKFCNDLLHAHFCLLTVIFCTLGSRSERVGWRREEGPQLIKLSWDDPQSATWERNLALSNYLGRNGLFCTHRFLFARRFKWRG